tara:strand:- start:58 stop:1191 length:1134 start_codon:yes stop_codon:yes gene_type:complete
LDKSFLPIKVTKPLIPDKSIFNKYVEQIFESKQLTNAGPLNKKLTDDLKKLLSVKNLVLTCNGTASIRTMLACLDYDPYRNEIIVPSFTFVATISSIVACGYRPIFVDILENNGTIDPKSVENAISEKTAAIMGVHCYGNPCDNYQLEKIARKAKLYLFYDAAHAFGVIQNGESILNWGDASALSFHATKIFSTCEGGAIVSENDEFVINSEIYINNGMQKSYSDFVIKKLGMNAKLSEINAAFGLAILDKVDNSIEERKIIYEYYVNEFKQITEHLIPYLDCKNCTHNFSYAPFLLSNKKMRNDLFDLLKANHIFSRKYFYPLVSDQPAYSKFLNQKTRLINSMKISNQIICLPIYPSMAIEELEYIIKTIKNFFL